MVNIGITIAIVGMLIMAGSITLAVSLQFHDVAGRYPSISELVYGYSHVGSVDIFNLRECACYCNDQKNIKYKCSGD